MRSRRLQYIIDDIQYKKNSGINVKTIIREVLGVREDSLFQFLLGSYLGDGSFTNENIARVSFGHSKEQEDYLRYKHSILCRYNLHGRIIPYRDINSRYKSGYCDTIGFRSKRHYIFNLFREYYTPDKSIDLSLVSDLDAYGLAIWFMDDGGKTNYGYYFNTQSFTYNENKVLCQVLNNNFGMSVTIQGEDLKRGQELTIYVKSESRELFKNLINRYVIETMKYKL